MATPPVLTSDSLTSYQDLEYKFELKYSEEDYHPDTYMSFGFARDAGTNSNTFEHTTCQTQHANRCFEINISVCAYVSEIFPNLTEYSKDLLNSRLDPLIQTFRFLD
jgi:hypothetical protein